MSVGYRSKTGQKITDNRVISKWIGIYCKYYGYQMEKGRDSYSTWFTIREKSVDNEDDLQVDL